MDFVPLCLQDSVFIYSVHEAVNCNPECHFHILLQNVFAHLLQLKNPSTFRKLTENGTENQVRLLQNNSSISVMNVRGINCVYLILFQVSKTERTRNQVTKNHVANNVDQTQVFKFIPFWEIDRNFLIIKSADKSDRFPSFQAESLTL